MIDQIFLKFKASTGVSIDTRKLEEGNIFFALKGPNFDGNTYAQAAVKEGALCAVIDDEKVIDVNNRSSYILVSDVLKTLQELAAQYRDQLDIPVLAITGTNGKTTTKELIATVLKEKYKLNYTRGNLNNHIGVPLTLLSTKKDAEFLVVEMGANHMGEIDFHCRIAKPTHGIITNIGKAHLEGFGSFENIIKTKTELYRYLETNGTIIFNREDELLHKSLSANEKTFEYFPSELKILDNQEDDFLKIDFKETEFKTQLMGSYNVFNIACALAVGALFEVESASSISAIKNYQPRLKRSQYLEKSDHKFVLDAYNANPTSMKNSIGSFIDIKAGNKILILGEMLEMGEYSDEEHTKLVDWTNNYAWKAVWLVGKSFINVDLPEGYKWFETTKALMEWYTQLENPSPSYFLIKGSRAVKLEQFLDLFDE